MKTIKLGQSAVYLLTILMLVLVGCAPVLSTPTVGAPGPTVEPTGPTVEPTAPVIQFTLTVDKGSLEVTRGSNPAITLKAGENQDILLHDKITTLVNSTATLVYSDRLKVEIWQKTEFVVDGVTSEADGRIEATLLQNKGHLHVTIGDNAKAGVILITQDSQVTSQADGSVYSVCYKPGTDGLTCILVEQGSIEVRDKTTGKSQIYPKSVAGYTFNGQAPQPSICIHQDEFINWMSKMREGVDIETLGAMVARWNKEPCPGEATPTALAAAPTPTVEPTASAFQFILTVVQEPVKVTHGGTVSDLAKGQTQAIFLNDKITVGAGGRGQMVYAILAVNVVVVEILQGAEFVMGDMTSEAGGRTEVTLFQNKGHLRIVTGNHANATVILITQDSQITSRVDNMDYSVCYKPGKDGLTCVLVQKGSIEVRDKTTGKSKIYSKSVAGYTFNGQEPQPSICIHQDEYIKWLSNMRKGVTVETLGAMVARWIKEPCPAPATNPTTTPTPK